jgi:hypothetical protein
MQGQRARRLANVSTLLALILGAAAVALGAAAVELDVADVVVQGAAAAVRELVTDACPPIRWDAPWVQRLELHLVVDGYQLQFQGLHLDMVDDDSRAQHLHLRVVDDYQIPGRRLAVTNDYRIQETCPVDASVQRQNPTVHG